VDAAHQPGVDCAKRSLAARAKEAILLTDAERRLTELGPAAGRNGLASHPVGE
jgi:hypothetical protein